LGLFVKSAISFFPLKSFVSNKQNWLSIYWSWCIPSFMLSYASWLLQGHLVGLQKLQCSDKYWENIFFSQPYISFSIAFLSFKEATLGWEKDPHLCLDKNTNRNVLKNQQSERKKKKIFTLLTICYYHFFSWPYLVFVKSIPIKFTTKLKLL